MLSSATRRPVAAVVVILGALAGPSPVEAERSACEEAVGRAVRLLPRQPDRIVVLDVRSRSGQRHVEAFVNDGERVVYLVRQAVSLQRALKGDRIYDYVLATVIWHEMAHIDGADEAAAQQAEEQLWMEFIVAQRVDQTRGIRYLALLKERR
jgi:hypothetical protein